MALHITGLPRTIISVTDQDAAIAFYAGKLGFEVTSDQAFAGDQRWVEVAPVGSGHAIALAKPPEASPVGGAMTGVTIETSNIDADHATLRELGVDVDEQVMRHGGFVPPMFWFRDQDANVLLMVERQD